MQLAVLPLSDPLDKPHSGTPTVTTGLIRGIMLLPAARGLPAVMVAARGETGTGTKAGTMNTMVVGILEMVTAGGKMIERIDNTLGNGDETNNVQMNYNIGDKDVAERNLILNKINIGETKKVCHNIGNIVKEADGIIQKEISEGGEINNVQTKYNIRDKDDLLVNKISVGKP